jgi:hypothetical protein
LGKPTAEMKQSPARGRTAQKCQTPSRLFSILSAGWNIYVSGEPGVLAWSPTANIFAYMPCDRSNLADGPCDAEVETLHASYAAAAVSTVPRF